MVCSWLVGLKMVEMFWWCGVWCVVVVIVAPDGWMDFLVTSLGALGQVAVQYCDNKYRCLLIDYCGKFITPLDS